MNLISKKSKVRLLGAGLVGAYCGWVYLCLHSHIPPTIGGLVGTVSLVVGFVWAEYTKA